MSAMLERMAEAMWSVKTTDDAPQTEPIWRGLPERERDRWRYRARAALLAIREPSEAMMAAGTSAVADEMHFTPEPSSDIAARQCHTAMIDAILNERP